MSIIIRLSDKPAFIRNNDNKLVSERNNGNGKIVKFGVSNNSIKLTKKLKKLKS